MVLASAFPSVYKARNADYQEVERSEQLGLNGMPVFVLEEPFIVCTDDDVLSEADSSLHMSGVVVCHSVLLIPSCTEDEDKKHPRKVLRELPKI